MDYNDLGFELKQHLNSDEKLLWISVPKEGIMIKSADAFMIPFSLLWGGFAIFWEYKVINSGAPFFFMLWGIPFILISIYLIFGRFFYDSVSRKNTIYGITQNRIIIKSGIFKKSIKSINLITLVDVTLNEKSDGSGTIVFGSEFGIYGMFRGTGWPVSGSKMLPAFEMIPEVRKVYKIITDLQKEK